ncbi:Predicted amidohydrolase [Tropicimonas isoalkanivorans]|uniref:Predicted amidohydrolase n=2 Tax=Tropicimonas isoalkanivorans TaxID=441112 RepID=A0A1I1LZE3_9RHOB|nr:Predicted amidohydrolase [Tropicimonas isoalkanivorans]
MSGSGKMRTALLQLNVTDDPAENLPGTLEMVAEAASGGAGFVLTPEVTNCLSSSRAWQEKVLSTETDDPTLAALREAAETHGIWLLIGSLALTSEDPDGRFANRSFLIDPAGDIVARYDKIHMFDVEVSETESYRESAGFRPGREAICAETPFGSIGMTVCYDLRFPTLYRKLAQAGAQVLTIPAAFSPVTGEAHWRPLLQARAIECGAYVLAPAQCGTHRAHEGKERSTHGHSLAVAPWGEVLADGGDAPGITFVDIDMADVERARTRVPSLWNDREFDGP